MVPVCFTGPTCLHPNQFFREPFIRMNEAGHSPKNAIVLLIDGLNSCLLSPLGCTWVDTPAFDELAGDSVVFERGVVESVEAESGIAAFLSGRHPARKSADAQASRVLASLEEAGVHRLLVTDHPDQIPYAGEIFDQVISMPAVMLDGDPVSADEVATTKLAACFAAALAEIPKQASPFLCLLHLSSLTTIWDAPLPLRQKHRDEDDPAALETVLPPAGTGELEPDEILGITQAYAAQLETLDTCLDVFLTELKLDGLLENTLLMLAGLRGMPLGHHGQVGHHASHLVSDATWVPLFVRPADTQAASVTAMRCHELTTTSEWLAMVESWLLPGKTDRLTALMLGDSDAPRKGHAATRQFAVVEGEDARALWTPAWLFVEQRGQASLFVKPDDRWDVNPVQRRCRQIAEELAMQLQKAVRQLAEGREPALGLLSG